MYEADLCMKASICCQEPWRKRLDLENPIFFERWNGAAVYCWRHGRMTMADREPSGICTCFLLYLTYKERFPSCAENLHQMN